MGDKTSMARSEEEGQPMLLAIARSGRVIKASTSGQERQEAVSPTKGEERRASETNPPESPICPKAEGDNDRPRQGRLGRADKDRKQGRRFEGKSSKPWRTAKELGIVHPGSYCNEMQTRPHYWVGGENVEKGSLYRCRYCHQYIWLPLSMKDLDRFGRLVEKYGKEDGYCRFLNKHRPAKILLAKMQHIERLSHTILNPMEFAKLVDKILSDKQYDVRRDNESSR